MGGRCARRGVCAPTTLDDVAPVGDRRPPGSRRASARVTVEGMADRLARSTSPYLRQHAGNPVDWWEWGPDALAEARRRDVPLLVSIG